MAEYAARQVRSGSMWAEIDEENEQDVFRAIPSGGRNGGPYLAEQSVTDPRSLKSPRPSTLSSSPGLRSASPILNTNTMASSEEKAELPRPALAAKSSSSSQRSGGPEMEPGFWAARNFSLSTYLNTDVDPVQSTVPLAAYCFMTGFIDAVSFTAVFVWCGFQTGNSVQLALALARLFAGPPGHRDTSFHLADQQALTSLITFILGAFVGRIGDKMGAKTRAWLVLGTLIQALFTMAAAIAAWKSGQPSVADSRGDPAWSDTLTFVAVGFMSASLGLQGIMGKRVNTQFATTIVLTTVWCELMADPKLFQLRKWVISRDHKLIAVAALFFGGFVGRALIDQIGAAATLGVGTGVRFLIALGWFFVPAKSS